MRTHECFAWSETIINGLAVVHYMPFMYYVPYLRLQDWRVLGLSSVYAIALSFQSALTVIWPMVVKASFILFTDSSHFIMGWGSGGGVGWGR